MRLIEVEAEDIHQARAQLTAQILKEEIILSERILADGKSRTSMGVGETEEMALADAQKGIASKDRVVKCKTLNIPEKKTIKIESIDEQAARSVAEERMSKTQVLKNVGLSIPGRLGFLGIGRTKNTYTCEVFQKAVVEITYVSKAKIAVKVDNCEIANALDYQMMEESFQLSDQEKEISHEHNNDLGSLALKAGELQNQSQWDKAFLYWRILTNAKPERASSWGMCGLCLQQMTESAWIKAIPDLAGLAPDFEGDVDSWRQGIRQKLPHANLQLAIAYLNRALSIDDDLEMGWYIKAHCLSQIGLTAKNGAIIKRSLECFEQALRIKSDSRTKNEMSKVKDMFEHIVWG